MRRSLNNNMKILHLSVILALTMSTPVLADDTRHLDDTVAAGIVFKIGYLFQSQGTWAGENIFNPERFEKAMKSISRDLSYFSNTQRGDSLKKEGDQLISFVIKGVVLTSRPSDSTKTNNEMEKFLRELGLDSKNVDPAELAQIITNRIANYAKLTNTPRWVYDPTKREQVGAPNPLPAD